MRLLKIVQTVLFFLGMIAALVLIWSPHADASAVEWVTVFPAELVRAEFAGASKGYQLAFSAATFAELMRGAHYTAEITWAELAARARRQIGSS